LTIDTVGLATWVSAHVRWTVHVWIGAGAVVAVLSLWAVASQTRWLDPDLVPGPWAVVNAFVDVAAHGYRGTSLAEDVGVTLYRLVAGFLLACAVGLPIGLLMGYSKKASAVFDLPIQFLRPLPSLSYLTLLIIWLGTGDTSKIGLLFLATVPVIATSAAAGVRSTKISHVQVARSLGASDRGIFWFVVVPSTLPALFTGMRIGLAIAFSAIVAAEILASTNGLGWMIFSASSFLRNDILLMGVLLLGVLGVILSIALNVVDKRVVHWRGRS